jgi:acid phosphatase class B
MIAIFDIDGVLADCSERVQRCLIDPVNRGEAKNWDGLFADDAIMADEPIIPAFEIMDGLYVMGWQIWFFTGRPERTRKATTDWLEKNCMFEDCSRLIMRPDGDHTDDDILKSRFLDERGFCPDVVFEDRDRIVKMYRDRGITCYQTRAGSF